MEKVLKYSILRYSPSKIAGEQINLGIIFDAEADTYREFRYSKKFSRVSNFDDEVDIDVVKGLLKQIKQDVEGTLFSYGNFDIDDYVNYYINDFSFEKPKQIIYEDMSEVLESLYKTYFRFEFDKADRPTKEDDKKMVARILRDSGKKLINERSIFGKYHDKVTYDIVTDDYKIKFFDFDNKDLNKLVNSAKAWAWNGRHNTGSELIIIYRYSDEISKHHNEEFDVIMNILDESNVKVVNIDKGLQLLQ